MTVHELAHDIRTDLDQITDWLRWAHTEAFVPAGPRSSTAAERPPDLGRLDRDGEPVAADELVEVTHHESGADPDHVPGARHDTGQGDHRTAQAWRRAVKALTAADDELVMAAWCCGHRTQPPPGQVPGSPAEVDLLVARIRARLTLCDSDAAPARARMRRARDHVDLAWRSLHGALVRGAADPDDQAVGEGMCLICAIRPTPSERSLRCSTCQKFWQRSGRKQERPRSLDDPGVAEAKAALVRRKARGEGWGDESFTATVPTPVEVAVRTSRLWALAHGWALALCEGPLLEARVAELADLVDRFGRREERAELRRLRMRLDRARRGEQAA